MSTVAELVEGLEKTGTRGRKLDAIVNLARDRRFTSATEVASYLRSEWTRSNHQRTVQTFTVDENDFERETGIGPVTIAKAEHLAAGLPLADLLGKPPRDYEEEKNTRLAKIIVETLEAQQAHKEELAATTVLPKTAQAVAKLRLDPAEQREQNESRKK